MVSNFTKKNLVLFASLILILSGAISISIAKSMEYLDENDVLHEVVLLPVGIGLTGIGLLLLLVCLLRILI